MRTIRSLHEARRADIDGLVTYQAMPTPTLAVERLEPFIFLNHHGPQTYPPHNAGLPFGPHPHRGFETVTFILTGDVLHRDTGGYESLIGAGGVQWMTAGRGLIHAETSSAQFKAQGGALEILQLWLNLPARLKLTDPRYIGLQRDQVPGLKLDGGRVTINLVAGAWDGAAAPVEPLTDVHLCSVYFQPGGRLARTVAADRSLLFYVVRGTLAVNGQSVGARHIVEFNRDGDEIEVEALTHAVLLFGHARPNGEPVASYGPFVMNTTAEIAQAIKDYRAGRFGVWPD
ncbi:MAG TPA: pirin family protein [Pyrinomonadaceae bacterium]|jgi:hypothetical protein